MADYKAEHEATAKRLKTAFDYDPEGFLAKTEDLTDADFKFIGKLIQQYCFADFCSRRIIDTLYDAAIGPEARIASTLHDSEVLRHLRSAAEFLGPGNVRDTLLAAAAILEMHRDHRNDFAHKATRRVRQENALISFSKNAKDAKRRAGIKLDGYEFKYGVLPMAGMQREIEKLDLHVHNLSVLAPDLERRIEDIRAEFNRLKTTHQQDP